MSMKKKILIVVEDGIDIRNILTEMLSEDYHIIEARHGQEALAILQRSYGEIALILLDLTMSAADGLEFLPIVKNEPSYAAIPIIVSTAAECEGAETEALLSGAADFIRRPFHRQVVRHRVKSIIALSEKTSKSNLSRYDHLTGLYSSEYFYKAAAKEITLNPDRNYDIICCNIENFSLINYSLGYEIGDEVLKATAEALSAHIPDAIFCARMNCDIFAILVPCRETYTFDFFKPAVEALNSCQGYGNLVLKFGIYQYIENDVSIYTAFNRALSVIDKVKSQFTCYFAMYDDAFHKDKLFARRISASMGQALKNNEFSVYYQPKFDLTNGAMLGAEALARWHSTTEGAIPPSKFIPLFEKNGFITELDKYIWEQVCAFLHDCVSQGLPLLPISVNVSRLDLFQADIAEFLLSLIHKYGLAPQDMHLEITESAYHGHPEHIIEITDKLHGLGFILEMDDFGTGYSSLNMLSEMTLDVLKLDIRFAQKDSLDPKQKEILSLIIDLAKRIGLTVISEGVETLEQVNNLKALGCTQAQGYFFSEPISSGAYKLLIEKMMD